MADIDLDLVSRVLGIVLIDLVLSGDNAVVIGLAARRLGPRDRRRAIFWGGVGAIGLRVLFTALTAVLLGIPALQFLGGLLLVWIAFKLLREEHAAESGDGIREGETLLDAIRTIVLADVIMSLDNILAVGGVAHGDLALLLFGLGLSMPLILFGSGLVAALTTRLPWLVYAGCGVLAWTAADMMAEDVLLGGYIPHLGTPIEPFPLVVTLGTLGLAYLVNRRQRRRSPDAPALRGEREAA